MELRIVTGAEAEEAACVVCMLAADTGIVARGSHQESCPHCERPIWVAPSSPKGPPRICLHCFAAGRNPTQGGRA